MKKEKTGFPSVDKTHLEGIPFSKLHPVVLSMSLLSTFELINKKSMDKIAIEKGGVRYSKKKIRDDAIAAAKAFTMLGHGAGETLTIYTPTLIEGVILTLGANAIRMKVAYADDQGPRDRAIEEMNDHGTTVVAIYNVDNDSAYDLLKRVPTLRTVIHIQPLELRDYYHGEIYQKGAVIPYEFALQRAKSSFRGDLKPILKKNRFSKEECIFLQTSGSTATKPKCLPFTNENVFASLMYAKNSTGTKTHDSTVEKVLCILSYRHPYGWMTLFVNLLGGNRVEIASGYSPEEIGKWYLSRPSYIYGTPEFLRRFMEKTPEDANLAFLRAFFCAGMETDEELYKEGSLYFRKHKSAAEIRNNYGVGELLCVGTASDGIPHRPGTSGKFYVGPTWVIVNEDLEEVKYGEQGELLVRSKTTITHYFHNEQETAKSFIEFRGKTFFRTGDFVSLSEDGYVTYYGRKKRFYQPRNSNDKVNPETIERALLKVAGSMVKATSVEIYDLEDKSKSSAAFVVLNDNIEASDDSRKEILRRLAEEIRPFEMPTRVEFIDEIPMLGSAGKIDHKKLEAILKDRIEAEKS